MSTVKTIKNCYDNYEIANPSYPDVCLDEQIELGINDWFAENLITGQVGYGKTLAEAMANIPRDFA